MAAELMSSDLAVTIVYLRPGWPDLALPALVGPRDVEARFGEIRSRQDTVVIEVRVADLEAPARGDRFELDGAIYFVSSPPARDETGQWWRISGYREVPAP